MATNICSEIDCPYWSNGKKEPYGCRRYTVASMGHLNNSDPDIFSDQNAMYHENLGSDLLRSLKEENESYLVNDEKYQRDIYNQDILKNRVKINFPNRRL